MLSKNVIFSTRPPVCCHLVFLHPSFLSSLLHCFCFWPADPSSPSGLTPHFAATPPFFLAAAPFILLHDAVTQTEKQLWAWMRTESAETETGQKLERMLSWVSYWREWVTEHTHTCMDRITSLSSRLNMLLCHIWKAYNHDLITFLNTSIPLMFFIFFTTESGICI